MTRHLWQFLVVGALTSSFFSLACSSAPEVGDAAVDAGAGRVDAGCTADSDCSDGLFCNGAERCQRGACMPTTSPCAAGLSCDEARDVCGSTTCATDADGDGSCSEADCDDSNPARYPGAIERCDGLDQDCNPATLGADQDGDGSPATDCCNPQPSGSELCGTDCDDTRATVNITALETCNLRDDDCDGMADEGVLEAFFRDADGDGAGNLSNLQRACVQPAGYVQNSDDCDDTNAAFRPSATDSCALPGDDDCDGSPDDGCACTTGAMRDCGPIAEDGIGICRKGRQQCLAGMWESACAGAVVAQVERCNAADDDCDGMVDDGVCVSCGPGYTGADGMCVDIDECGGAPCGVFAAPMGCTNTPGSYTCACAAGYGAPTFGGTCTDIDECSLPARGGCDARTTCTNSMGGRTCGACPAGFVDTDAGSGTQCRFDDPLLVDLLTSAGYFTPFFQPSVGAYAMTLPLSEASVTVTPVTLPGFTGSITVQGQSVTANTPSAAIALPLGATDITVRVTSETGRSQTYTLRVVRGWEQDPAGKYIKASNSGANDLFGCSVALSADGLTLAVGASGEASNATGVGGNQASNAAAGSGAVYVFGLAAGRWVQQAYIKASNPEAGDGFGASELFDFLAGGSLALSGDGSVLAVGAPREDSAATGIGGSQGSNAAVDSGAVYVFRRTAGTWAQEAYIKASNTGAGDGFGRPVALSADGATLAVGATSEASNADGVNGNQADNAAARAGAVYVFRRGATVWAQEAYVKASNSDATDEFGSAIALTADGSRLAVGAHYESSSGAQSDNSLLRSGAAYVFTRSGTAWSQEAYLKASNPDSLDEFGLSLALSADGTTLAVGATGESSRATGVGGDQADDSATSAGAAYVLRRAGAAWTHEAYVKAPSVDASDRFGYAVSLSADGASLAVSARFERSNAVGVGGDPTDNSRGNAGAAYVLERSGGAWRHIAYLKASSFLAGTEFGRALALSGDGQSLVVGMPHEECVSSGIDGNPENFVAGTSDVGAVYAFHVTQWRSQYVKAPNTGALDAFGTTLAVSADGTTLAIGAPSEDSDATGIGGAQNNDLRGDSGAVYVLRRAGSTWSLEAYIKASNAGAGDQFGGALALSADGSVLVVGAALENGGGTGLAANEADESAPDAGAAYVFRRTGTQWAQEAYVKASNAGAGDAFGVGVALSGDGATFVVGALGEASDATGVGGTQSNDLAPGSGAAYVFRRTAGSWAQEAFVKASNAEAGDRFGRGLALSSDGNVLAVAASQETSASVGIGGNQASNTAIRAGAVYVFRRAGTTWTQQAYIKASNTGAEDLFGESVALSADGTTLAVGAIGEDSGSRGVGANQNDESGTQAGAVYVFRSAGAVWAQESYVKPVNARGGLLFGKVSLSADGSILAVGATGEASNAAGLRGDPFDVSISAAGAVYLFRRTGTVWTQTAYHKATNPESGDFFGACTLSGDGRVLAVASYDDSGATGVGGNQQDNSASGAGAVYVWR